MQSKAYESIGGADASIDPLCRVRSDAVCARAARADPAFVVSAHASVRTCTIRLGGTMPHHTVIYPLQRPKKKEPVAQKGGRR